MGTISMISGGGSYRFNSVNGLASQTLADDVLRNTLNSLQPDEVELYIFALRLVDDDKLLNLSLNEEFLLFPVNPSSVVKIQKTLTNIKKTFGGVHINNTTGFVPIPINLSGDFGVSLKLAIHGSKQGATIKTGYGLTKYLEKIILKSRQTNATGKPYRLILYNLSFGDCYTIEVNDCKFSMTEEKNRIWHYDLNCTAVAPGILETQNNYLVDAWGLISYQTTQSLADKLLRLDIF